MTPYDTRQPSGQEMKRLRLKAGIRPRQMAKRMSVILKRKVSLAEIRIWEQGVRTARPKTCRAWFQACKDKQPTE